MASPPAAVLAIDGGNSKTDVALVGWDGTVLAAVRGPEASQEHHGIDGATGRLAALIREVAGQAGLDGDGVIAGHLSACLAGADLPGEEAALTAALAAGGWARSAVAVNDTFAVLRGGGADQTWGAAVTCGAGLELRRGGAGRPGGPLPGPRHAERGLGRRPRPGPGGHVA